MTESKQETDRKKSLRAIAYRATDHRLRKMYPDEWGTILNEEFIKLGLVRRKNENLLLEEIKSLKSQIQELKGK
jgi:hypothetical protein